MPPWYLSVLTGGGQSLSTAAGFISSSVVLAISLHQSPLMILSACHPDRLPAPSGCHNPPRPGAAPRYRPGRPFRRKPEYSPSYFRSPLFAVVLSVLRGHTPVLKLTVTAAGVIKAQTSSTTRRQGSVVKTTGVRSDSNQYMLG